MLSAYLYARASERELERCDGRAPVASDRGRSICSVSDAGGEVARSVSSNRDSDGESTEKRPSPR